MLSRPKTHPLLETLCERVGAWRQEIGLQTTPHTREFQGVLDVADEIGVEPDLVIFTVAVCERWFRIHRPSAAALRRALRHRLKTDEYTPHGMVGRAPLHTSQVLKIVNAYVDQRLSEFWEEDASEEKSRFVRVTLQGRINEFAQEWARPFLVAENRPLPPRRGGYPRWAPWVAATVLYRVAREHCTHAQDSRPVACARRLTAALRGRAVASRQFHAMRRLIERRAPGLVENIMAAHQNATRLFIRDPIGHVVREEAFASLAHSGGLQLVLGQGTDG